MRAKRVVGLIACAALTVSTVFGPTELISAAEESGAQVEESAPAETTAPAESAPAENPAPAAEAAPAVETPVVEVPAETTVIETPVVEQPVVEPPTVDVPVETPAVEQPTVTAPEEEVSVDTTVAGDTTDAAEENGENSEEVTDGTSEEENTDGDEETLDGSEEFIEARPTIKSARKAPSMTMELTPVGDDEGTVGITAESEEEAEVIMGASAYTGIEINGDFTQWDSVDKTTVDDGSVKSIAMVFDGDVYVYIQGYEEVDWGTSDVATGAGVHSDGMFAITTDTGRVSVFYVRTDGIYDREGNKIEGAEIAYNGDTKEYEVKLPASFVKQYNETISIGYYLDAETDEAGNIVTDEDGNQVQHQIISDVADLSESGNGALKNEIEYDESGNYGDWDTYTHQLIEYSTAAGDAEGALYSNGDNLYMHVATYAESNNSQVANLYNNISIRFNRNDSQVVNCNLVCIDDAGNVTYPNWQDLNQTAPGIYHYYLYDTNGWGGYGNINDDTYWWNWDHSSKVRWIYGEITMTVTATGTEMEVKTDLAEFANRLGVDQTDLKYIQAQFINIGTQWISCAGTSSGPIPGILMGVGVVAFAAWGIKKKEEQEAVLES